MQNQNKLQDAREKVAPLGQEYDHITRKSQCNDGQKPSFKGQKLSGEKFINVGEDKEHCNVSSIHQGEIDEQSEKLEYACKETNIDKVIMEANRVEVQEAGPRERLDNHRNEVSGRVWIPEMWGKEELLKDWIDCSSFDACLVRQNIMSARASMIEEARRNSSGIRVQNS